MEVEEFSFFRFPACPMHLCLIASPVVIICTPYLRADNLAAGDAR